MDQRIGERQRWAWLASGLSAAVAACACGFSWAWVLGAGLLVTVYYIYMDIRLRPRGLSAMLPQVLGKPGRVLAVLTLIWMVLLMAWAANLADGAFPMVNGYPVLGWSVLALAAWGSWKGAGACARCAGVLCLFLLALYGVVIVFAVPDVQLDYLLPKGSWQDGFLTVGLFLLPAAVWYVPCTRSKKKAAWQMALLLPAFAGILTAVTSGVLSPTLARSQPSPLYSLAQSVSLFGVVERIEPLLSAAMTMGAFCLVSAMACACGNLWGQIRSWRWSGVVCCAAAGTLMKPAQSIDFRVITAGNAVFMVVIPVVIVLLGKQREKKARNGV